MATNGAQAKSGLRELKPGEILFNDSEPASLLFKKVKSDFLNPRVRGLLKLEF